MEDAAVIGRPAPGRRGAPGDLPTTPARSARALVLAALVLLALAVLAFVVLGLVAGPPRTLARLVVAPWRATLGDAASAAGFAATVAGAVLVVRAGQVGGARRSEAAELVDALDAGQRRAASRAVAGHGSAAHGDAAQQDLHAGRAVALVVAARWTVVVLFAGLLLTALGRAVVAVDLAALVRPLVACVVLAALLAALVHQGRRARAYLLHHPDRRTPPVVAAALARWRAGEQD